MKVNTKILRIMIFMITLIVIIVASIGIFILQNLSDKSWKTFKNSKYKYSFEYPKDWKIQNPILFFLKRMDEIYLYSDKGSFEFRSGEGAKVAYSGYKIDSREEIEVAGEKAIKTFLSGGNPPDDSYTTPSPLDHKMIQVEFTKNNIHHLIVINNFSEYAVVSDPVAMKKTFEFILKTIKFENKKLKDKT
ncbi:MAG: hypothetical protein ABIB46_02165 [bacterium]